MSIVVLILPQKWALRGRYKNEIGKAGYYFDRMAGNVDETGDGAAAISGCGGQ
jgi:hypothetical protein